MHGFGVLVMSEWRRERFSFKCGFLEGSSLWQGPAVNRVSTLGEKFRCRPSVICLGQRRRPWLTLLLGWILLTPSVVLSAFVFVFLAWIQEQVFLLHPHQAVHFCFRSCPLSPPQPSLIPWSLWFFVSMLLFPLPALLLKETKVFLTRIFSIDELKTQRVCVWECVPALSSSSLMPGHWVTNSVFAGDSFEFLSAWRWSPQNQ